MSMLKVKTSKKVTVTCSLEESTAAFLNQYRAYLEKAEGEEIPGDAIVDAALLHVFERDKKFQQYLEAHRDEKAPPALRVKVPAKPQAMTKAVRKQKQPIAIAQ